MPRGKRSAVNLTDLKVKSLKADPSGEFIQGDTQVPGFGVRVRPTGVMTYTLMKRLRGETKPIRVTIGRIGEITLADAREKAREHVDQVKRGLDPNRVKREEAVAAKATRVAAKAVEEETGYLPGTFGELATRYIKDAIPALARGAEIERTIKRELLPILGPKAITSLRRRDLLAVVESIIDSGRPAAAHKVREIGKRITAWGADKDRIDADPFHGGESPVTLKSRDRTLTGEEIAELWQAWATIGPPLGSFFMFALATGQRESEIATMERNELNLASATWEIPAEKSKNGQPHVVPLSRLALQILEDLKGTDKKYVFSTRDGTHISGFSKAKKRAVELSSIEGWRIHDLRRTFATRMAQLGIPHPVVARLLNHSPRGVMGVTAVYNRFEYMTERKGAMERWGERLRIIVSPKKNRVAQFPSEVAANEPR